MNNVVEIGTDNYILHTQLESCKHITNFLELQQNKNITILDIKYENKVLRINIFDLFTFCAILNIKLTENDLKTVLKQYSLFHKSNDELRHEQMLYMEYLDDLNEIMYRLLKTYREINLIGSNLKGGVTLEKISEDVFDNLYEFESEALPKMKQYTKTLNEKFNEILNNPKQYSNEIYNDLLNKIMNYKEKIIIIRNSNDDIKELSMYFKDTEFDDYIQKVINGIENLIEDLNMMDHLLSLKKIDENVFKKNEDITSKINLINTYTSDIEDVIEEIDDKPEYLSFYIIIFIIISIIIILIVIVNKKTNHTTPDSIINKPNLNVIHTQDETNMLDDLKKMDSSNQPKLGVDIFGDLEVN